MDEPANIYESIDRLIELQEKKNDLLRELKRALLLADLVGVPPKDIKGPLRVKVHESGNTFRPWTGTTFSVRIGDDPWEDFPLIDVHKDLWPEHIRAAFDRWERNKGKLQSRRIMT